MSYVRLIKSNIWDDPDFQECDQLQKLMFVYLFSNSACTASGIYPLTMKTASFYCGCTFTEATECIKSLKNVEYDPEMKIVFVCNFRHHQSGGNPARVERAIIIEYLNTKKAAKLWESFVDKYPEFKAILEKVRDGATIEDTSGQPKQPPKRKYPSKR